MVVVVIVCVCVCVIIKKRRVTEIGRAKICETGEEGGVGGNKGEGRGGRGRWQHRH